MTSASERPSEYVLRRLERRRQSSYDVPLRSSAKASASSRGRSSGIVITSGFAIGEPSFARFAGGRPRRWGATRRCGRLLLHLCATECTMRLTRLSVNCTHPHPWQKRLRSRFACPIKSKRQLKKPLPTTAARWRPMSRSCLPSIFGRRAIWLISRSRRRNAGAGNDHQFPSPLADRRTPERIRRRGRHREANRCVLRPGSVQRRTHRNHDDRRGATNGGRFRKIAGTARNYSKLKMLVLITHKCCQQPRCDRAARVRRVLQ